MKFNPVNTLEPLQPKFMLSEVLGYLHKCQIPGVWGHRVYLLVWREEALFLECRAAFHIPFPPLPLFSNKEPLIMQVRLLYINDPVTWVFMGGLSSFDSHWCSLHLGADSQYWKLQDVSGTQLPHTVAKKLLIPFEALTLSCNPQILLFLQFVVYAINLVYLAAGRSHVLTLESIDDVINQRQSGLKAYIK